MHEQFFQKLAARGPHPSLGDHAQTYARLIGSWSGELTNHMLQGQPALAGVEAHFAWVLEGRAVQDVWIMPRKVNRAGPLDKQLNMYGSTLRAWDSSIQAWRISWSNPAGDHFEQQIGRRSGDDIVQLGQRRDGSATRWRFTEITADSFHWLGESQPAGGGEWLLEGEFLARRANAGA